MKVPQDLQESFHVPDSLVCELQLRTILQDAWAEVEHELVYKSDYTPFDDSLRRKLAALNANLSLADMVFHEIREYQRELQHQLKKRRTDFWNLVRKSEDEHRGVLIAAGELEGHLPLDRADDLSQMPPRVAEGLDGGAPADGDGFDGLPKYGNYDAVDGQLLKALYVHNAHRYPEAVERYSGILELQPRQAVRIIVLVHRGMAYFALGRYREAIEDFGRSLDGEGDHRKAYYYRAVAQRQLGAYAEALDDLNQCLSIDPYQAEALLSRAQTLVKLGDYSAALQDVDAALALRPHDEEAHRFREVLTSKLGV
jgi:putative GTP pyrophosphokinase